MARNPCSGINIAEIFVTLQQAGSTDKAWSSLTLSAKAKIRRKTVLYVTNFKSARYMVSKDDSAKQFNTHEKFHFGVKILTIGLSLSKDLISLEICGSFPSSKVPKS